MIHNQMKLKFYVCFICVFFYIVAKLIIYLLILMLIGARGYQDQLYDSIAKTNVLSGK